MNLDSINEIMNCQCLQSIIQNNMIRNTFEDRDQCNRGLREPILFHKRTAKNCLIKSTSITFFREERIFLKEHREFNKTIDRVDKGYSEIPFLFCPICGTKSKHDIPEESFYHQFQL